jgi:hypothetical protein
VTLGLALGLGLGLEVAADAGEEALGPEASNIPKSNSAAAAALADKNFNIMGIPRESLGGGEIIGQTILSQVTLSTYFRPKVA